MKKGYIYRLSCLLCALMTSVLASAQAPGTTCENAIPVGQNYSDFISGPGTYWFAVWSYDLPLRVTYTPTNPSSTILPDAWVDFTCTPGVYDDPTMTDLFTGEGVVVDMPVKLEFETETNAYGQHVFSLSVGEKYREVLTAVGLTSDVLAYVKVVFSEIGQVDLAPDTTFRDCMETAEYVHLGDTFNIFPNDNERVFVMPYSEWRDDSVRFVWRATGNHDVRIWMGGNNCNFEANTLEAWDYYDVADNGFYRLTETDIENAIENIGNGGMYYCKILTAGAGQLIVERVPEKGPDGDAILLQYGRREYQAAGAEQLYAFKAADWADATQFIGQAADTIRMYIGKSATFSKTSGDPDLVGVYTFCREDNSDKAYYFSESEMTAICNQATDKYLYVRFESAGALAITPDSWDASSCAGKSSLIKLGESFSIAARASNTIYRLRYSDIKGGNFKVTWAGTRACPVFVADTCDHALSSSNSHVVAYLNVQRNNSITRDSATVAGWANRVDADGYLYIRMNAEIQGRITFSSIRTVTESAPLDPAPTPTPGPTDDPIIPDPEDPTPDPIIPGTVTGSSIGLTCPDERIMITVTEEQTLTLYDSMGHVLETWHQTPGQVHYYTPTCGVQYTLKGKSNTFKIVK